MDSLSTNTIPIRNIKKRFVKGAHIVIRQWYGRLGNNLMQLSNALFICEQYNCQLEFPGHPLLQEQQFDFSKETSNAYYISNFYYRDDCRGVFPNLTQRRRIMLKYIRPLLKVDLEEPLEQKKSDRLVLQVRSGDIFNQTPNPRHLPAPLAYYSKIINQYQDKEILIVYQNQRNPCIQELQNRYPHCKVQSSELTADFATLIKATNLAISPGTFGFVAALLSTKIKRLYVDDLSKGILNFGFFDKEPHGLDFEVIGFHIKNYIQYGKWVNTPAQYQLVLSLPEKNVIPAKVLPDANFLANYYLKNWKEFSAEGGHAKLLRGLKQKIQITPDEKNKIILALDVGANVGFYLIHHLRHLCKNDNSRFLVFEPNPINLSSLKDKIKVLSHLDIQLFPVCVSDVNEQAELMTWKLEPENKPGNALAGLRAGGQKICDVEVIRLEKLLDEIQEDFLIKIMKIDTEGNDTRVIKGLGKYIRNLKYLIFEASDCLDDYRGPGIPNPLKDIVIYLDQNGFDTYRLGTKKMIRINGVFWHPIYEQKKFWSNCFAIKKGDPIIHDLIDKAFNYKY